MKLTKTLILTAVAASLVLAATTHAKSPVPRAKSAQDVDITGSTAYRANVYAAIQAVLDSGYTYAYSDTASLGKSTYSIFNGTIGGTPVTIKTHFTGSEGGIQTLTQNLSIAYYPDGTTGTVGGTANAGTPSNTEASDVTFSDSQQASSAYSTPALTEDPNSPVGVVPFKFIASKSSAVTFMTAQLFRALATVGTQPLSMWTGNSSDSSKTVYLTGRDPDSGTRVITFGETGFGAQQPPVQYAPYATGQSGTNFITTAGGAIDHFTIWPKSTVNGVAVRTGQGGYSSGGSLAAAVNSTTPANTTLVSYAGTNDADPNIALGEVELPYNGVTLGNVNGNYNTDTSLTQGTYTLWGYEHCYVGSTGGAGTLVQTVADSVAGNIKSTNAVVLLGNMVVSRTGDGGTITHN